MIGVSACLLLLMGVGQTTGRDIAKEFPARSCLDLCDVITSKNRSAGYKCECHNITTSDGFVLQTARMPPRYSNGTKLPVFLMHGFITSAIDWVSQPETSDSLPYMLSDAGYDVWLGNNRGNVFSVTNEKLSIQSPEFWDKIDQDQMATMDVPTIIDYVLGQTGKPKLHWVGHSQGGGVLVFALAENPSLSKVLATSALLAPGVHMANLHVPLLKTMVATHVDQTWHTFGIDIPGVATAKHYFPGPSIEKILEYFTGHTGVCSAKNFSVAFCNDLGKLLGISVGDPTNLDPKTMATAYNMDPGGSSFHLVMHWAQRIRKDTLQKFDWGLAGNLKNYGRPTAPTYDLKKIKGVHLGLWTGLQDLFITPKDVASFVTEMNADNFVLQKTLPTYAHFDFPWGKNAKTLLYPDVINLLMQETVFEREELLPAAFSSGGSLALTFQDCGDSSTDALVTDVEPKTLATGSTTTITGSGSLKKDVTGGSYTMTMTGAAGIKLLDCSGDASQAQSCDVKAPLLGKVGSLDYQPVSFPIKAGDISGIPKVGVTLKSGLPGALEATTTTLQVTGSDGDKVICVKIMTKAASYSSVMV